MMGVRRRERSELQVNQLGQKLFFSSRERDAVPRRLDFLSGDKVDDRASLEIPLSLRCTLEFSNEIVWRALKVHASFYHEASFTGSSKESSDLLRVRTSAFLDLNEIGLKLR
mgnify:CR=1 FL=1